MAVPYDPPPSPSPPSPPAGWSLGSWAPAALGDTILYWWPEEGWQLGRVVRVVRRAPFTHVVRYRRSDASFTGDVDTLLDAASHGSRWVRLVRSLIGP